MHFANHILSPENNLKFCAHEYFFGIIKNFSIYFIGNIYIMATYMCVVLAFW